MDTKQLQKALDTPAMHDLVNAYLMQRAFAEIVREQVNEVYAEILRDIPAYTSKDFSRHCPDRERITDHNQLYLCGDDELCDRIYDEADKRLKAAKIKPLDMEHDFCPALVAEDKLSQIERQLIETSGKPMNVSTDKLLCSGNGLDNYRKWIDLVVGAIVNSPNFKPTKLA